MIVGIWILKLVLIAVALCCRSKAVAAMSQHCHIVRHAVILLVLIQQCLSAVGECYDGCLCIGDIMKCSRIDRIPHTPVPESIIDVDMSNNQLSSRVLRRDNFTELAASRVQIFIMRSCGINTIEYNTFMGKWRWLWHTAIVCSNMISELASQVLPQYNISLYLWQWHFVPVS